MSASRLSQIVERAIAEGVLPPDAVAKPPPERPWPVIVLTAVGSWLTAIPLLGLIGFFLLDVFSRGTGFYLSGILALGAAIVILRRKSTALFLEQFAIPLMLAGACLLAVALDKDFSDRTTALCLAILALGVAAILPHNWLRILLAGTACALAMMATVDNAFGRGGKALLLALHVAMAAWVGAQLGKRSLSKDDTGVRAALALDAMSMGWGAVTLAGLAIYAGSTFLLGSIIPGTEGGFGPRHHFFNYLAWHVISALTAAAAAAHLVHAWPSLRQTWAAVVAGVAIGLSLLMPSLGATLLFLAMCASAGRWRMAATAGLAAAWIIGAFYYQVSLPLATKAAIMVGTGVAVGAAAWLALRGQVALQRLHGAGPGVLRGAAGIAVTAAAVLLVANVSIGQKEHLIANGKPIFVELGPVDPRSLMQGDYMELFFPIPMKLREQNPYLTAGGTKKVGVGKVDARGVITLYRLDDGKPLAADEKRIRFDIINGSMRIVTDAWYFREGEAERYASARYGEFRVMENGRALLVGMRGQNLEKL